MSEFLVADGLVKNFGALTVTDNLSFSLSHGEALGIIGPNGAGKSSLFNLIAGVLRPDAGKIMFKGQDITNLSAPKRCHTGIGRTYQIPRPFNGLTVYENLLVAAEFGAGESESEARINCKNILDNLGLIHKANDLASSLSLLERKRLELARALATKPELLLLDEIAGGLTELECVSLIATIKDIRAQGVSIIWIEHIVHALFSVVDRLMVIDFGHKVAEGDPEKTFNSAQVQQIYMGIEA